MFRDRGLVTERLESPGASGPSVRHGFERGEGLRGDDEERLCGVEVSGRLPEVGAVNVRHEPEGHRAVTEVPEGLVGHAGAEVAAADAHVDDVADAPPGVTSPVT